MLIASYCRTEDAYRLGALTHPDGTAGPELIDIVFRDLAAVHGIPVNDIKKHYKKGDYFAWNWSQDPFTMGRCFLRMGVVALLNGRCRGVCVLWSGSL